jgi:integrase
VSRFSFTRRSVEALPAHDPSSPSREAEYSDSGCVGLHLRVSKGGRKFYQLRYTFLGRKRCLSLGEHTERFGVQEARTRVAEHKASLARGVDPSEEREKQRADLTVGEFVQEHYLPLARARKRSVKDDLHWLKKAILPALGNRALRAVTTGDVTRLHLREKELTSATSANHLLATLKTILSAAVRLGFLDRNPAAGGCVAKFQEPPPRDRFLSREEFPRFLAALEGAGGDLAVSALRLLCFTGMRSGEATSLRWEQVDLENRRVVLRVTKNGRSRHVHLNSKALEVLRGLAERREPDPLLSASPFVFPSRAGTKRGHVVDLRKPFRTACEAAGVSGVRIHDLRRTFASWLAMGNTSLHTVSKLLGHRTSAVTESTYAHLSGGALLDASEGIVAMLAVAEAEEARKRGGAAVAGAVAEGGAASPGHEEQAAG